MSQVDIINKVGQRHSHVGRRHHEAGRRHGHVGQRHHEAGREHVCLCARWRCQLPGATNYWFGCRFALRASSCSPLPLLARRLCRCPVDFCHRFVRWRACAQELLRKTPAPRPCVRYRGEQQVQRPDRWLPGAPDKQRAQPLQREKRQSLVA